jgi:hypothetical protein
MVVGPRGRVVEDDLVVLAVDWPEVGLAQLALALIGALYRHEALIREQGLTGQAKLAYRSNRSDPPSKK